MPAPPIPCVWTGEVFEPLSNFARVANEHFGVGEVAPLVVHEERSAASHRHYFACVHEGWLNLPEHLAKRHPSSEALRKYALIQTGYRNASSTVCMFKTEARRLAAAMEPLDEFSVVVVEGKVVTRYTAQSQSIPAMGKERFQASKDAVLGFIADLIGVSQAQLSQARAA